MYKTLRCGNSQAQIYCKSSKKSSTLWNKSHAQIVECSNANSSSSPTK